MEITTSSLQLTSQVQVPSGSPSTSRNSRSPRDALRHAWQWITRKEENTESTQQPSTLQGRVQPAQPDVTTPVQSARSLSSQSNRASFIAKFGRAFNAMYDSFHPSDINNNNRTYSVNVKVKKVEVDFRTEKNHSKSESDYNPFEINNIDDLKTIRENIASVIFDRFENVINKLNDNGLDILVKFFISTIYEKYQSLSSDLEGLNDMHSLSIKISDCISGAKKNKHITDKLTCTLPLQKKLTIEDVIFRSPAYVYTDRDTPIALYKPLEIVDWEYYRKNFAQFLSLEIAKREPFQIVGYDNEFHSRIPVQMQTQEDQPRVQKVVSVAGGFFNKITDQPGTHSFTYAVGIVSCVVLHILCEKLKKQPILC